MRISRAGNKFHNKFEIINRLVNMDSSLKQSELIWLKTHIGAPVPQRVGRAMSRDEAYSTIVCKRSFEQRQVAYAQLMPNEHRQVLAGAAGRDQ